MLDYTVSSRTTSVVAGAVYNVLRRNVDAPDVLVYCSNVLSFPFSKNISSMYSALLHALPIIIMGVKIFFVRLMSNCKILFIIIYFIYLFISCFSIKFSYDITNSHHPNCRFHIIRRTEAYEPSAIFANTHASRVTFTRTSGKYRRSCAHSYTYTIVYAGTSRTS